MVPRLGSYLKEKGVLSADVLERALRDAKVRHERLGTVLIDSYDIAESTVYQALAAQFSLPFIAVADTAIDRELLRDMPSAFLREGRAFPLYSTETALGVLMSDPIDLDTVLALERMSGLAVETSLTTPSGMESARERLFDEESVLEHSAARIAREYEKNLHLDTGNLSLEEIMKRTESEPVVRMVSLIFDEAIELRASDIHIEPTEQSAAVRFRIDGMLRRHMDMSRGLYIPITSRIKILADLDIAEKRIPQDGRIRYNHSGRQYDFRVSTLPTHYGEKTVIRILKHDLNLLELSNLGIAPGQDRVLRELISKPQGMVFVTGPTGSGKSSTLFACLNAIRGKEINITTIENPIEYKLEGINQVQINEKAGVTFARTLRSILRQDPDVILIGETRDRETAEIAIQASQTGHLVFSTLHTNDAISAITRLRDLKIASFLIASSLLAVISQRLVRTLCPSCRKKIEPSADLLVRWKKIVGDVALPHCYEAVGCKTCRNTGYQGRLGIFEVLVIDEEIRTRIADDANESDIKKALLKKGHHTMLEAGIQRVIDGSTTPEELLRVVMADSSS